jgi:hypothetical protein
VNLQYKRSSVSRERPGKGYPGQCPTAGSEVEIETQRVQSRGTGVSPPGAEVVVNVKERDRIQHRRNEPRQVEAFAICDDVRVADIEQHPHGLRFEARHERANLLRIVAEAGTGGIDRAQVLQAEHDPECLRPARKQTERALLGFRLRTSPSHVESVIDDVGGAQLVRVFEQPLAGAVVE